MACSILAISSFSQTNSNSFTNLDWPSTIFKPPSTCSWQLLMCQLPAGKPHETSLHLVPQSTRYLASVAISTPLLFLLAPSLIMSLSPCLQSTLSHYPLCWKLIPGKKVSSLFQNTSNPNFQSSYRLIWLQYQWILLKDTWWTRWAVVCGCKIADWQQQSSRNEHVK